MCDYLLNQGQILLAWISKYEKNFKILIDLNPYILQTMLKEK